jgi:hypothetical protein
MHEARRVRMLEAAADLKREVDYAGGRKGPALTQLVSERPPFDVLHDDEGAPVLVALVVDVDDVRMRQLGGHARLSQEPLPEGLVAREVLG